MALCRVASVRVDEAKCAQLMMEKQKLQGTAYTNLLCVCVCVSVDEPKSTCLQIYCLFVPRLSNHEQRQPVAVSATLASPYLCLSLAVKSADCKTTP